MRSIVSRVRTRSSEQRFEGQYTTYDGNFNTETSPWYLGSAVNLQKTEDFVHRWPDPGNGGDIGGPFLSQKVETRVSAISANSRSYTADYSWPYYGWRAYKGPLLAEVPKAYSAGIPPNDLGVPGSDNDLIVAGTEAVGRTIPTNPVANVSVMLGELLREGVPKAIGAGLLKSRFKDYREIGSEYLNYQFGWAPIAADLKSVAKAVSESEKRLAQLKRDSGRPVRRRLHLPTLHDAKQSNTGGSYDPVPWAPGIYDPGDRRTITETFERKRWFSGCYTFHFEMPNKQTQSLAYAAKQARVLYGLDLTPEVVWNLAPWTWLSDWAWNAGDIMSNASRFSRDGLVMRYGYIMEHTMYTREYTIHGVRPRNYFGVLQAPQSTSIHYLCENKARMAAHPFGFGMRDGDLDLRQQAILGALGLSRGPRLS
jgi:hypothetical protein